jgi:hypothetical protein
MTRTKAFLTSKGFWGSAIAIVTALGDIAQQGLTPVNGMTLFGGFMALYGRWVAEAPLSIAGTPKP